MQAMVWGGTGAQALACADLPSAGRNVDAEHNWRDAHATPTHRSYLPIDPNFTACDSPTFHPIEAGFTFF